VGAGDLAMAGRGRNDRLTPTSAFARILAPFVPDRYDPFVPDVVVDRPFDLAPFGLSGEILPLPGHTPGAQAVVLDNRLAIVGDMVLGGSLGGLVAPRSPGEHYFHADREENVHELQLLVDRGIRLFLVGHGGPVARPDVIAAFHLTG
jgi:hydroxyacylglutathione hydrolase